MPGIEKDARFDGFRRSYLDIFQVNPRLQMLANNSSSDPCAFTLFEYSEVALHAPPLAKGLTCLDLVRMTLDRYLAGAKGYGQVGYGTVTEGADLIPWPTPYTSSGLASFAAHFRVQLRQWREGLEMGAGQLRQARGVGARDDAGRPQRERADRISRQRQLRGPADRGAPAIQLVGHHQFRP